MIYEGGVACVCSLILVKGVWPLFCLSEGGVATVSVIVKGVWPLLVNLTESGVATIFFSLSEGVWPLFFRLSEGVWPLFVNLS